MSIEPDDLHKPLGLATDRGGWSFAPSVRALAAATLIGAGIGTLTFLAGDADHAGEPFATASIKPAEPQAAAGEPQVEQKGDSFESATASELEAESGVAVVRSGGGSAPGALVIRIPDPPGSVKLAAAPDPRLVERSEFGQLPRVGADGHARRRSTRGPPRAPRKGEHALRS